MTCSSFVNFEYGLNKKALTNRNPSELSTFLATASHRLRDNLKIIMLLIILKIRFMPFLTNNTASYLVERKKSSSRSEELRFQRETNIFVLFKNAIMQASESLSNLQLELLKIYATNVSDEDLMEIKRMLAKFFMEKAIQRADEIWDERGYDNELMDTWRKE